MTRALGDDRLGLIFACCHPALAVEARVALTLRFVAGLTTREIATAFVVPEATLAQRLVRAKRKIRESGIRFTVPSSPDHLAERLSSVRTVVYLVFNEGFASSGGAALDQGRPVRRGDLAGAAAAPADARRRGDGRAARAHAAAFLAPGRPAGRRRAAGAARRAGPLLLGRSADRRGHRGARRGAGAALTRVLPAAGGDRGAARRGRVVRGDRLAADRAALPGVCRASTRRRSSRSTGPSRSGWRTGRWPAWPCSRPCWHPARSPSTARCTPRTVSCWKKPDIPNERVVPGPAPPRRLATRRYATNCSAATSTRSE